MRRGAARAVAAALLLAASVEAFAEAAQAGATPPAEVQPGALPPGFRGGAKENPWRRFEIVAFGAFPIVLFYVDFGFDLYRYIDNGFASTYAPWPFKTDSSVDPTEAELFQRLAVAGCVSLLFSGVDAFLHQAKLRRAQAPEPQAIGEPRPAEEGPAGAAPAAPGASAPAGEAELDSAK